MIVVFQTRGKLASKAYKSCHCNKIFYPTFEQINTSYLEQYHHCHMHCYMACQIPRKRANSRKTLSQLYHLTILPLFSIKPITNVQI